MDPNSFESLEKFVQGMEKVNQKIKSQNPDIIIAPMMGANSFIDVLNIIDGEFPNEKVEYVPASSRLENMREILRNAFYQILQEHKEKKYLALDEVVSGNSAVRVYKQFNNSLIQYANQQTIDTFGQNTDFTEENIRKYRDLVLQEHEYRTIGLQDERILKRNNKRNEQYLQLIDEGIVIPIDVGIIPTMDNSTLTPWKYSTDTKKKFQPKIDRIEYTPEYITFLRNIAEIVGKNPSEVEIKNITKIMNAYKGEKA